MLAILLTHTFAYSRFRLVVKSLFSAGLCDWFCLPILAPRAEKLCGSEDITTFSSSKQSLSWMHSMGDNWQLSGKSAAHAAADRSDLFRRRSGGLPSRSGARKVKGRLCN